MRVDQEVEDKRNFGDIHPNVLFGDIKKTEERISTAMDVGVDLGPHRCKLLCLVWPTKMHANDNYGHRTSGSDPSQSFN